MIAVEYRHQAYNPSGLGWIGFLKTNFAREAARVEA